jgi:glycosyltransferase involved in cell wall biosynthesis
MIPTQNSKMDKPEICIASPFPPPYGGMAIQAEKLAAALEQQGWRVSRVPVNQELGPSVAWIEKIPVFRTIFRTALFLCALNRALNQCNIVYLLSGFFDFFFWVSAPAIILVKLRKKRIIMSARGGGAGAFFERYRLCVRPFVHLLDAVTAPSGFLQQEFSRSFGLPVKIIPNIADIDQFRYRQRLPVRPMLICSRNLEPIYNVGCSIRAFALVKQVYPEARMGIAGDGSERSQMEALCRELGIDQAVQFMGQIPHDRMPDVYDCYDILINSSNVDNTPGVILEASAAGIPIVTTRSGGIPFLIEHDVTGLLVELNNERGLADAVIRLLREPDLANRLASEARSRCSLYSPENVVREFGSYLRTLMPFAATAPDH